MATGTWRAGHTWKPGAEPVVKLLRTDVGYQVVADGDQVGFVWRRPGYSGTAWGARSTKNPHLGSWFYSRRLAVQAVLKDMGRVL